MSESIVSRQATPASIENIAVTSNDGVKSANLLKQYCKSFLL